MKHQDLQAAVKDINTVMETKHKFIASGDVLKKVIVDSVASLIGAAEDGSQDDPRLAKLQQTTIDTYNTIVQEPTTETTAPTQEEIEKAPAGPVDEIAKEEGEAADAGEEGDCFGVSYDPENPADCCTAEQCGRFAECVAKVTGKKKKAPAAPKEPKEPKAPSPRGVMLDVLCQNPGISKEEMIAAVAKAGFVENTHFKKASLDTVYSDCQQVFKRLRQFGYLA